MWIRRGDIDLLLARGGALPDEHDAGFFARYGERSSYELLLRPIIADHTTLTRLRRVLYPWRPDIASLTDQQVLALTVELCLKGRLSLVYRLRPDTMGTTITPEEPAPPIATSLPPAPPPLAPTTPPPESTVDPVAQANALQRASDSGKPFCEVCEKAKAEREKQEELANFTKQKADEEQQKPSSERSKVVAGMQTPDGKKTSGSSFRGPRAEQPDHPPKTKAAYDSVPGDIKTHQNGKCAEAMAIADYERATGDLPPPGTRFDARNVRGPNSPPPPQGQHGTPKPACKMCSHVMKQNGWTSETGYE